MKWVWLFGLILLICAAEAKGQTAPIVGNHATSTLTWDWAPGPEGGEPIKTFTRCGLTSGGPYNLPQQEVLMPAEEIRFNKLVPRPGKYFCILVGWNMTGEGPSSDEIPLESRGSMPPKPINVRLK